MKANDPRLWSRRTALQTLALGAGGLTTALGASRDLRAAGLDPAMATPRRLLIMFSPNGIPYAPGGWAPWLIPGAGEGDFKLTLITSPLERHRQDVVFFDNLMMASQASFYDKHHTGAKLVLTGAKMIDLPKYPRDYPGNMSVDQFLAQKIGRMATPQWPSLEIVAQESDTYVSFSAAGTRIPAIRSPVEAYDKLFAGIADNGTVTPDPGLLRRLAVRKSVLDSVAKDVASFRRRLPKADQARADAQLDTIRGLEGKLVAPAAGGARCARPAVMRTLNARDSKAFPQVLRASSDVIVSAFACDLTRVATFNMRGGYQQMPCDFAPINDTEEEHGLSHVKLDKFAVFKQMLNEEMAYIADRLKAIPEGAGSMLDNTIILQVSENGDGHNHRRLPWLTIGGANLGLRTGRVLTLPTEVKSDGNGYSGYPHQKLFVSLLHAMGLTGETAFGTTEFGTGPMTGLLRG